MHRQERQLSYELLWAPIERTAPRTDSIARFLGVFSIGLGIAEMVAPGSVSKLIGARRHPTLLRAFGAREIVAGAGILAARHKAPWLWSRVAGDVLDIAALVAAYRERRSDPAKLSFALSSVAAITALDVFASVQHSRA